jgi:hypothetical protein
VTVRVLAYFNPERLINQRASSQQLIQKVTARIEQLNQQLAAPRSRRGRDQVAAEVDRLLRESDLLTVFSVEIEESEIEERRRFQVRVKLKEDVWARRRRFDGFTILVSHQSVTGDAERLSRQYRAKDAVEKDFQTIKSLVDLRPVHHRTDVKVRAHVTVCMLALLLERTLTQRLGGHASAPAALELLSDCRLNRLSIGDTSFHVLTQLTDAQRAILRKLKLEHVATADAVDALASR